MNVDELRQCDQAALNEYLWRRLRLEPPMEPPISVRFGEEPPEQFLIQAVRESGDAGLRTRTVEAVKASLGRLAVQWAARGASVWTDPTTDQQVASLAFLASALEAAELVDPLYRLSVGWLLSSTDQTRTWTAGQFHFLRTLARLQSDSTLAGFWKSLWESGPRAMRGLTIFGWARADASEALQRLGELVDMADEIDLPTTAWSLIRSRGPGFFKVAEAAGQLSADQRSRLRDALEQAGADEATLRDFDLKACPPADTNGDFRFPPETAPTTGTTSRQAPGWGVPLRPAA